MLILHLSRIYTSKYTFGFRRNILNTTETPFSSLSANKIRRNKIQLLFFVQKSNEITVNIRYNINNNDEKGTIILKEKIILWYYFSF